MATAWLVSVFGLVAAPAPAGAAAWLKDAIDAFTRLFPQGTFFSHSFNVTALLAVLLVSVICGAVGSLVVGNRMAFFSDALAHCALAGVVLGFLVALAAGVREESEFARWITAVMIAFGALIGLAIAYVRERTGLSSDTVIGVFYAGAMGFGAMLIGLVSRRKYFTPEVFLFGNPLTVRESDLIELAVLALVAAVALAWMYNHLLLASFNPSLARSRRTPVRLCSYLFIVLLALIVNLSLKTAGLLLINALLIIPAATASLLCRNMRQLFWGTMALCLIVGVAGVWLSWEVAIPNPDDPLHPTRFGIGGALVVFNVVLFFLAMAVMAVAPRLRGLTASPAPPAAAPGT